MFKKFSWDRSQKQSIAGFIQTFSFLKFTRFFHDFLLKAPICPWTLAKNDTFPLTLVSVTWLIVLKWSREGFTKKKKITKNATIKIHYCEQKNNKRKNVSSWKWKTYCNIFINVLQHIYHRKCFGGHKYTSE